MSERAGKKTFPGRTRVLETKGRMEHGDPNPGNRVVAPFEPATRESILNGTCPFCGKGPFKLLAGHTQRAHGVDRMELRALGGFVLKESICAAELSETCRKNTIRRQAAGELPRGNPGYSGGYELGPEGRKRIAQRNREMAARARAAYEGNPDLCEECGAPIAFARHNDSRTCGEDCRRRLLAKKANAQHERARAARAPRTCPVCGATLLPSQRSRVKTCSAACGAALRAKGPGVCRVCSGPVERRPDRSVAKTCSVECLRSLYAARDAKRRKARPGCTICGEQVPASMPATAKTCSDACLRASRSATTKAWRQRDR